VIVAGLGGEEPREAVESAVHEVEVQVVRQWPPPVGAGCRVEQLGDVRDVVGRHLALDLETTHGPRVSGVGRAGFEPCPGTSGLSVEGPLSG
jgi:hypothetical protein